MPPVIWPRSAILHSAAASIVAGIFELTVSTAARIATFGCVDAERHRQIDRVLADVDLVFERRRDVDRGVGDDEHLVIGRHVHDEDVADAAAGAQTRLPRDDRAEQLVACAGCPSSGARPRPCAPAPPPCAADAVAVRRVDDPRLPEIDARSASRPRGSWRPGRRGSARSAPLAGLDRAGQRRLLARMRHRGRHRLEAPAPRQQLFVLSGSGVRHDVIQAPIADWRCGRRPGLPQQEREHDRQADAVQAAAANAVW